MPLAELIVRDGRDCDNEGKLDEPFCLKRLLGAIPLPRGGRSEVPAWAGCLSADEFEQFRATLDDALGDHELERGVVTIPGRSLRYGVTSLLEQWSLVDPSDRAGLVHRYSRALFEAEHAPPPEGEELLRMLRPRLWNSAAVSQAGPALLTRDVADELVAVLCIDRNTTVANLDPEQAATTGRPTPELWKIAMSQIDDGYSVIHAALHPEVHVLHGESVFVASRLLDLARFAEPARHGTIFAAPTRHMLMFHRVETLAVMDALQVMAGIADGFHRDGPGSLVPHLYWSRAAERPLRLPTTADESGVAVEPPDEFLAVLNELPA